MFFNRIANQFNFFRIRENRSEPVKIEISDTRKCNAPVIKFVMEIMAILRKDDYVIFHGAALAKNGGAKVFLGPSQSGKTTISLFSAQNGYRLICDDVCVINKKNLTVAPFVRNPLKVHSSAIRFFEECDIHVYSQNAAHTDKESRFKLNDLRNMGISFADKEYPIEKIHIFRNNEASILRNLPTLCYLWNLRSPEEVMEDVKFFHHLLEHYPYKIGPGLNLNTARQRKVSYNQMRDLLGLT